jgi:predicted acetyltransferase
MSQASLETLTTADAALLGNLMELYIHDLSAMFPHVKLGADGRFGYPALPTYLEASSERHAFVIRHQGSTAGFILARRGSPASDDPNVLDIAEFFVLRQFRGRGVGRAAAAALWDRMPGSWTVRASTRNPDAVKFWRRAVSEHTNGQFSERERLDGSTSWVVLLFGTRPFGRSSQKAP